MQTDYKETLFNPASAISARYFAIFQLKNIGNEEAIRTLMEAYPLCGSSVLLKHELLYALGQLKEEQYGLVRDFLISKMADETENALSRHEAA